MRTHPVIDVQPANSWGAAEWDEWQALNEQTNGGHPALQARFMRTVLHQFGSDDVLGVRSRDHRGTTLLALAKRQARGQFELFAPSQAPYGPLLVDWSDRLAATALLRTTVRSLPSPAYSWQLYRQNSCGNATDIIPQCIDRRPTMQVDIDGKFDAYWQHPRPVQEIRRQLRRLSRHALDPKLWVINAPDEIFQAIDAHADLEAHGWKGRQASAIVEGTAAGDFYRRLLGEYSQTNDAFVFQLFLAEHLAASLLTIRGGTQVALLKTTYDERYRMYGPGRLLDYMMLQHLFDIRAAAVVDFCNVATPVDLLWATRTSFLQTGGVYRNWAIGQLHAVARSLRRCWRHT